MRSVRLALNVNPYAPPNSAATDAGLQAGDDKPRDVAYAVRFLWASIVIGVIEAITVLRTVAMTVPVVVGASIGVPIIFGLFALIILGLNSGKNWVRWLFTVVVALGCVQSYRILPRMIAESELRGMASLVQDVLQVMAVVLLHTMSARKWFTRNRHGAA